MPARVAGEVHHRADGARLHFHQDGYAGPDLRIVGDLAAERPVGDVLEVDVQGGAYVVAVHGFHRGAVEVADILAVIGDAPPFDAFRAVEFVVVSAFDADAVLLPDVADDAAGEGVVRVDALVVFLGDEAALVSAFPEQGQCLQDLQGGVVHIPPDEGVLLAVLAPGDNVIVVLVRGLGGEEEGEFAGERVGLGLPVLLRCGTLVLGSGGFLAVFLQFLDAAGFLPVHLLELGLPDGAVHIDIIEGGRDGERAAVLGEDASALGLLHVAVRPGTEEVDDPPVHGIGRLDVADAQEDAHRQGDEQRGKADHHQVDAVPVLVGVPDLGLLFPLRAHRLSILMAGCPGSVTSEPSCFRRFAVVEALCRRTSSASFSAWYISRWRRCAGARARPPSRRGISPGP